MRVNPRDIRGSEKAKTPLAVQCDQTNCVFHEGAAPGASAGKSLCSHMHKRQYMVGNCPLYHLDWMKQVKR